jgi:5-methylcytosine-specific restriction endonuclease McrA
MALAPLHQCHRCRKLVRGKCETCSKKPRTRSKASAEAQKLYDWRWQQASRRHREANPVCLYCEREGRTTAATCVDHVIPHRGNYELFWDESNWASSCDDCHRTKTAKGL